MNARADFPLTAAGGSPDDIANARLVGTNMTPAEAALAESVPAFMHPPTYAALFDLGIHGAAITGRGRDHFDALHVEPVVYLPGNRFELARNMRDQFGARVAVIIPCENDLGVLDDLAAW